MIKTPQRELMCEAASRLEQQGRYGKAPYECPCWNCVEAYGPCDYEPMRAAQAALLRSVANWVRCYVEDGENCPCPAHRALAMVALILPEPEPADEDI